MDRKQKYALIKDVTGNVELARRARNWGEKRINDEILSMYKPSKQVAPSRSNRAKTRKIKYDKARNAGYSPVEATKMQDWSMQHINDTVRNQTIVNKTARRKRWKYMSIRRKMDTDLDILARKFNNRKHREMLAKKRSNRASDGLYKTDKNGMKVYDKNHGFGWGIVYTYYTTGIDPEILYSKTTIDPFIPEIYRLPNTVRL